VLRGAHPPGGGWPVFRLRTTIAGLTAQVLVVASQKLVREGIRFELSKQPGLEVVETSSGLDAIGVANQSSPDLILLELELADRPGAEICAALVDRHPNLPVIVISARRDEASVRAALDAGARGYLLSDDDDLDLVRAVERALAGERVLAPQIAGLLLEGNGARPKLSAQELKVLRLVAEGLTNPEIGARLYLSRHTVKEYVSHAMRKLDATNRIEAVRTATALGLIEGISPSGSDQPQVRESLVYNDTGAPVQDSELRVTPLKIDRLETRRDAS
jgi:two-component system, NarL family, response regulator DevR